MINLTGFQDSDTPSQKITAKNENLLIVQDVEVEEFGIKLFINPSPKSRTLQPLKSTEHRDLIFLSPFILPHQSYVYISTRLNYPMVYHKKESEKVAEDLMRLIPQKGEAIAVIIKEE